MRFRLLVSVPWDLCILRSTVQHPLRSLLFCNFHGASPLPDRFKLYHPAHVFSRSPVLKAAPLPTPRKIPFRVHPHIFSFPPTLPISQTAKLPLTPPSLPPILAHLQQNKTKLNLQKSKLTQQEISRRLQTPPRSVRPLRQINSRTNPHPPPRRKHSKPPHSNPLPHTHHILLQHPPKPPPQHHPSRRRLQTPIPVSGAPIHPHHLPNDSLFARPGGSIEPGHRNRAVEGTSTLCGGVWIRV